MWNILLRYYVIRIGRYFKKQTTAKVFTVTAFLFLGALLMIGSYLFFLEGFGYISSNEFFSQALFLYVYEIFFPFLAFLLAFSGAIFGIFSLFRGQENNWIMASPGYNTLFIHKMFTVLVSSSWPIVIVAAPFVLAVATFFNLSFFSGLVVFLGILAFSLTVTVLSVATVFFLAILLFFLGSVLNKKILSFRFIALAVLIVFLFLGMFFWFPVTENKPGEIFDITNLSTPAAGTEKIINQFEALPTHSVALAIHEVQQGYLVSAFLRWIGVLAVLFIASVLLALLKKKFLVLWQKLQEGEFKAQKKSAKPGKDNFFKKSDSLGSILFKKEWLKLIRNKRNLLWLMFSLSLWLLYSGVNYYFIKHSDFQNAQREIIPFTISALQFLVAIYFTAALVLRFAFPSFSEERKSVWIIASAPLNLGKLFIYRAVFYSFVFTVIGILFGFLNFIQFQGGWLKMILMLDMFALSIVFVSVLGLALGAIFPNFETDDPQKLSTSLPGLALIFFSLAYGVIASYAFYLFYFFDNYLAYLIFGIASAAIVLLLAYLAVQSLKKKEFVKVF
ncbi:MAG: hypothetical protein U5L10_00285 [Candidatus Moranbacteria bacterium]|nr:hypothetical protein [Candidatus Moranbacteria bacterium]